MVRRTLPNELLSEFIQNLPYRVSKKVASSSYILYELLACQQFVKKGRIKDKILQLDSVATQLGVFFWHFYKEYNKEITRHRRINPRGWFEDFYPERRIPFHIQTQFKPKLYTKYRKVANINFNLLWLDEVKGFIKGKMWEEAAKNGVDFTTFRKMIDEEEYRKFVKKEILNKTKIAS